MKTQITISKTENAFQLITEDAQFTFSITTSDSLNKALLVLQGKLASKGIFAKSFGGAKLLNCQTLANATPADEADLLEGVTVQTNDATSFDMALALITGKFASKAVISKQMSGAKNLVAAIALWNNASE